MYECFEAAREKHLRILECSNGQMALAIKAFFKTWIPDKAMENEKLQEACGDKILKVIIETCLLTQEEKIRMCQIVTRAGADYIKTSTGFSTAGATVADVELMKAHIGENVKIKAAGGIASFADAEEFIRAGAERLGTSRLVKILKTHA